MKKYLEVKNPTKEVNVIKIELYYSLGGYNCWYGKPEKRGYYLCVTPLYKSGFLESYTMFTGVKQCIKEVNRKSEKAYTAAAEMVNEFLPGLIDLVCNQCGVEVLNA